MTRTTLLAVALTAGHESEQVEVLGTRNAEKKSIKVEKIVAIRQR